MKIILFTLAVVGTALGLPQFGNTRNSFAKPVYGAPAQTYSSANVVPIVSYSNDIGLDGSFQYSYQTGDGISAQANAQVRNVGGRDVENSVVQTVQGSYSYTAPDGQVITVNYVADENGYRAEGAHLPTPPPIPPEIQRSLALTGSQQGQSFGQGVQSFRTGQFAVPKPVYGVSG
ncbi:Endocuticle structural glycoprotein SgAbd-2, putative [Pediculus humanus corporis]|uniref:Endocuticle structural glycoprotein SgAbd-2, putative n=1 Tax=Pediculus humanus subsp. corporis TaxID=121224 RepID=E0VR55_PEDHC|nr:Endocuticle structural glycoprotein SgAbd-2, putative [Pediculus humanus corporis]EEB15861.1 Endocuticle structural glycoprotein SgAbd-2, putative [Pediculus humanus corporis]